MQNSKTLLSGYLNSAIPLISDVFLGTVHIPLGEKTLSGKKKRWNSEP